MNIHSAATGATIWRSPAWTSFRASAHPNQCYRRGRGEEILIRSSAVDRRHAEYRHRHLTPAGCAKGSGRTVNAGDRRMRLQIFHLAQPKISVGGYARADTQDNSHLPPAGDRLRGEREFKRSRALGSQSALDGWFSAEVL